MKLIAYLPEGYRIDIRPAPVDRAWMDATDQRFAYRCLPLNMANGMGWELLCPDGFVAEWDGGQGMDAIRVHADPGTTAAAVSHFRHGILTFHIACLFRTEPGYDLVVQGPINRPKDGIAPLAGVVETDWAPYGFTMNWMFTRPGAAVRFERGEPFCHIFPLKRGELETIEPEVRPLAADPDLARQYENWKASRAQFNKELLQLGSQAQSLKWQKQYYRGITPDGRSAPEEGHRTRMRLKAFAGVVELKRQLGTEEAPGGLQRASQANVASLTERPSEEGRAVTWGWDMSAINILTSSRSALAATDATPAFPTLRSPHLTCDDFLPNDLAAAMRQDIDNHFDNPGAHLPETHQVWNYWHIPQLYTYLRTNCDKIIEHARMQQFMAALTDWSVRTLGMGYITWPYLSLYVSGCKQGIHNDSTNGRFAFVYSLTKNDRKTSGGETIVLKEGDAFRSRLTKPGAGTSFYDLIAPKFNRLAVFDDRMPHAVERVDGSMDPIEGRFVLHGHISESGPIVQGALAPAAINAVVHSGISGLVAEIEAGPERYHGPVALRFTVLPSGNVADAVILVDRVSRGDEMEKGAETVAAQVLAGVMKLSFPQAPAGSQVTLPVIIGGPLPWMRQ
jgi:hypothetical protein